jgi:hypothetical protein
MAIRCISNVIDAAKSMKTKDVKDFDQLNIRDYQTKLRWS